MDVEALDEFSHEGGPPDWDFSERALRGFTEALQGRGLVATLFVTPRAAEAHAALLTELAAAGHELGLHVHPQDEGRPEYLGALTGEEQERLLEATADRFAAALGYRPGSFRPGNFSANDYTFPALVAQGFDRGSVSTPGRNFTRVRANWVDAEPYPHYVHAANRLLAGDLPFFEVPVTSDPTSMIWGGLQPVDLRIELSDARAHGFTLRKVVDWQIERKVRCLTLVPITHNVFDYSSETDFRRQVLLGVIDEIHRCADTRDLTVTPATLAGLKAAYDKENL
jgi:peptidoglycan/xylan/chitin deacetylase (PgdA/CDA1 family)